jgi:aquaporin Z
MSDQFRTYFAEIIGTGILVFVGGLSILSSGGNVAIIAFGFGLALMIGLYAVGEVSGGHFNPAVTLAAFLDGRINLTDGIGYWISQVAGGVLAGLGLWWAADQDAVGSMATEPGRGVGDGSAFLVEALLTAFFVMVILKVTKSETLQRTAFGAISFALVGIHMAAVPITGASVNPARSIGPALVGNNADNLWIYLLAPLVGAIVGWIFYQVSSRGEVEMHVDTE